MAQKSEFLKVFLITLSRVLVLCIVVWISSYTSPFFLDLLEKYMGYTTPSGFFGFTLADAFVPMNLALVFWGGIIFGALGRRWDYVVIALLILSASYEFISLETITSEMYLGLAAFAIVGNSIGFILKLLRQKFLPKLNL